MELTQVKEFTQTRNGFRDIFIVIGLSVLFALAAWISIRFPFSPVPISFTAQLVLLSAVLFGKRGAYATALYLAQGLMGLPVFANGGSGLAYLLGPTGGYLVGFVIAAYVVATMISKMEEKTPAKIFGTMLFGNVVIYVFGLPHLALLIGAENALKFGLYPFIAGDIVKLMLAQRALKTMKFFRAH